MTYHVYVCILTQAKHIPKTILTGQIQLLHANETVLVALQSEHL